MHEFEELNEALIITEAKKVVAFADPNLGCRYVPRENHVTGLLLGNDKTTSNSAN